MLSFFAVVVAWVSQQHVANAVQVTGEPCPFLNHSQLQQHPANATVTVFGGNGVRNVLAEFSSHDAGAAAVAQRVHKESLLHMQLYTLARELVQQQPVGAATVTVDCWSGRVGIEFAAFPLGMDCAVSMASDIMNQIDALDATDEYNVKLAHLLTHLDDWQAARACHAWTVTYPYVGAAIFYLVTAGVAYLVTRCQVGLVKE